MIGQLYCNQFLQPQPILKNNSTYRTRGHYIHQKVSTFVAVKAANLLHLGSVDEVKKGEPTEQDKQGELTEQTRPRPANLIW